MGESQMGVSKTIRVVLAVSVVLGLGAWFAVTSEPRLGPRDGLELSGVDTGRVAVGDLAPDFSLLNYEGTVTTLSDFRGEKNVVLQFYRGYW